ncbi:hypothetical protein MANES_01G088101v8 [Manihot esculenta]|uniref:Rhamnogalacturonase A/B/Epimerase-like pectate lyase domain-containing protein n=1 Tax=Manihot esculenta TaxID=3983 RepID=A0A2C9WIZ6_MANES|nr:hypothetical protein MANES_01G088101v8 [Manihot esculenta]
MAGSLFFFFFFIFFALHVNSSFAATNFNVLSYGAKPNGVTDSTKAFLDAWAAACGSAGSTIIYVPKGRYLLGSMIFGGGCKSPDITIRVDETLVAPRDYRILGKAANWLSFEGVAGVSIVGGALDAKGPTLWACKAKGKNCPSGATSLSFTNSNNIKIKVSDVQINDIIYQGIRGTSATEVAIRFDCSSKYPCSGIRLHSVNLTYSNQAAQSFCANVLGKTIGLVKPSSCL